MININTLHELFVEKLKLLYDAENQIVEALPKLIKEATKQELKDGLKQHLEQTENHVKRLEQIAMDLDAELKGSENKVIKTIIQEGEKTLKEIEDSDLKDAALIAGAQEVEHAEISDYGTAIAWAKEMNHDDAAELMAETLDEEKETDKKLSKLAEGGLMTKGINEEVMDGDTATL